MGTELAKEIQEIKRNWVPRSDNKNKENNQNDQNKDKDKNKGKGGGKGGRKKGINDVEAEENTPLFHNRRPLAEPLQPRAPQLGRSQDGDVGSADPSLSGVGKHKGTAAGGRPGLAPQSRRRGEGK